MASYQLLKQQRIRKDVQMKSIIEELELIKNEIRLREVLKGKLLDRVLTLNSEIMDIDDELLELEEAMIIKHNL